MKEPRPYIIVVCLLLALLVNSRLYAQLIKVTSELNTDSMMIGDQVLYTLRVEAAENVDFRLPAISDTLSKNLEVLFPVSADTTFGDGRRKVEHSYVITGFEEGMQIVPAQHVEYTFNGRTDTALSMPLMMHVYEPVVDTTQAIKPIKPPINTPLTFKELLPWLGLGLGILLIASLIAVLIRRYRQRRRDPEIFRMQPKEPAHVIAFRELDRLKEEKLWERGYVKQFYTRLTEITRTYIERQYGIPAMERTTSEILQAFRRSNLEDGLLEEILEELLQLADLVKFAKEEPLPVDNQTNLNNAYLFVQKTYPMFYAEKPGPAMSMETGSFKENSQASNTGPGQVNDREITTGPGETDGTGKEGLDHG